jgi:hypothetical protein
MNKVLVMKRKNPALRRYNWTLQPAMVVYILLVAAISGWFRWEPPHTGLGLYVVAMTPALPIGVAIYAILRYLAEEPDEFVRMLQVKATLIGFGLTLFICTAWGFLAQYAHVWALPLYLVFPLYCGMWGLTAPFVCRSYR